MSAASLGVPKKTGREFVGDAAAPKAAGVVFVAPDGDVLVLLRSATEENYASHWALPGGKADAGETAEQAAEREIAEEIGEVPPGALKLLNREGTPNGMVFSTYARPVETKFAPKLNDEHSGYAWTPLDKLPQPLHPAVAEVLGRHIGVTDDMTPEDWTGLRDGFAKWTREEEQEPGHAADEAVTDSVGRKHYERMPISKAAVNEYKGSEIPGWSGLGLLSDKLYRLLRDPEELAKGAGTFNGIQLLIKHTPVSAEDHKPYDIAGALGTNAEFEAPYLYNDVTVWSQAAIDGVDDKSRHELSSSYQYDPDMTPGTYEGQAFDGVMRNIRGNHTAVVPKGRVGPDVALDEAIPEIPPVNKESPMTKKAALLSRTALRLRTAFATLAMDESIKLDPVVKGVTAKNFAARRPAIAKAARLAFDDLGATGATPDDVIMKVLDMVGTETAAEPAEMDEAMSTEPNGGSPEMGGKMDMAKLKAWCASKGMGEDDMSELDGMMGEADDEDETEEEKAARMKKAMDDAGMVTKEAMDAALKVHGNTVAESVLKTQRAIATAAEFVRPWVGSLAMDAAINSEADVYRKALAALGVSGAADLHVDALKPVLTAQPKPGARPNRERIAMDAAPNEGLEKRFAHMAHITGA